MKSHGSSTLMALSLVFGLTVLCAATAEEAAHGGLTSVPVPLPASAFTLHRPDVTNGGTLPAEYTGFGAGATLPLAWDGAPAGTASYALIMHHLDPEGKVKWYWILYNIPVTTHHLPKNVKGVGTLGNNSVNGRTEYAPPHSKGPGPKIMSAILRVAMETGLTDRGRPAPQVTG